MPQDCAIQASHHVSLIRPTQQVAVPWDKVQSNKESFKPTESASIQKAGCMNGWLCSGSKKCWLFVKPYGTGYHHSMKRVHACEALLAGGNNCGMHACRPLLWCRAFIKYAPCLVANGPTGVATLPASLVIQPNGMP